MKKFIIFIVLGILGTLIGWIFSAISILFIGIAITAASFVSFFIFLIRMNQFLSKKMNRDYQKINEMFPIKTEPSCFDWSHVMIISKNGGTRIGNAYDLLDHIEYFNGFADKRINGKTVTYPKAEHENIIFELKNALDSFIAFCPKSAKQASEEIFAEKTAELELFLKKQCFLA